MKMSNKYLKIIYMGICAAMSKVHDIPLKIHKKNFKIHEKSL